PPACEKAEPGLLNVCERGGIAIQGVQAKQSLRWVQPFGLQITDNHAARRLKLSPIIAVACPREGAQPLLGMGLKHGSTGTHELTAFASEIARRTHLGQTTAWLGKRKRSDEGTLPGSLACTVNVEDEQTVAGMVKETTEVVSNKAMLAEVKLKLLTQGLQAGHVDVR